ncbi:protease pro-enzyme activation domain-containing protein [Acidicapsa dinghuensis]|uniref:Protease pro-enzyme activation domain-containing protein n=1 Tax=Acidicapsa dinghuensis TaxID=2218256 RepID=A0ABW1EL22_9BACT|nr:S53 family peptidase [Acidicapsa dinghuensis]
MKVSLSGISVTALSVALTWLSTSSVSTALPSHNVPKAVELATDRGRVNPTNEINLTVVLKLHNQAAYDKAVEALYDPASPTFHQWFKEEDFLKYAPTQQEFEAVKLELVNAGFSVVDSDPHRFSIRVHGTIGSAESAFQTEIHSFTFRGKTFDAHIHDAKLTGSANDFVDSVAGLERHQARPQIAVAKNFRTGQPLFKEPLAKAKDTGGLLGLITGIPLSYPQTFNYSLTDPNISATYRGTVYAIDPTRIVSYTPQELQTHYGLTPLIEEGYNGKGQTIALVEGYGYADAESDANAAAQIFGLPLFTNSTFQVVYPEGKPLNPNAADLTNWTGEIALDIQSAHAIAPGAKILVVASAGQDDEDQIASLNYIIKHHLANAVSSSWENDDEMIAGPAELDAFNSVLKKGAASGISFQFSTGDNGDLGLGTPVGAVEVPSDAPWAVAVGGTSILNDPVSLGDVSAGWGNNVGYIASGGPLDPPVALGFSGGAGGGQSQYFAKPTWQEGLPGSWRQVPDVSALADPYTGFAIVFTSEGVQYFEAGVGGTSLASPIFTAIWAIADQFNGHPLGFASPAVARLKQGEITDVVPVSPLNAHNPAGSVTDSNGTTDYTTPELFSGFLYSQTQFPAAIWPFDSEDTAVLSFGTDSSLTVTRGWDNVTGYGEPNGLPFILAVSLDAAKNGKVKK